MITKESLLKDVFERGRKAIGKSVLIRHLSGNRLTRQEAIEAMCYDCMDYYSKGPGSCNDELCPLWPYMPYNKKINGGKHEKKTAL